MVCIDSWGDNNPNGIFILMQLLSSKKERKRTKEIKLGKYVTAFGESLAW